MPPPSLSRRPSSPLAADDIGKRRRAQKSATTTRGRCRRAALFCCQSCCSSPPSAAVVGAAGRRLSRAGSPASKQTGKRLPQTRRRACGVHLSICDDASRRRPLVSFRRSSAPSLARRSTRVVANRSPARRCLVSSNVVIRARACRLTHTHTHADVDTRTRWWCVNDHMEIYGFLHQISGHFGLLS